MLIDDDHCNKRLLATTGIAFRNGTNPLLVQQFSDGIQVLQDNGDLSLLRSNFVGGAGGKCDTGSSVNQATTAISFMELCVGLITRCTCCCQWRIHQYTRIRAAPAIVYQCSTPPPVLPQSHHRYGLWIILAGAVVIGAFIMLLMRMQKRKKWRKRTLARMGSNTSDRSLGRTSTIGFISTCRRSFGRSKASRGATLEGKPDQGDVEAGAGSPGTPVPTALARIVSNTSQRTTTSTAETADAAFEDESDGRGSVHSSENEEQSDLQVVESSFKGMSKRVVGGKSKTMSKNTPMTR